MTFIDMYMYIPIEVALQTFKNYWKITLPQRWWEVTILCHFSFGRYELKETFSFHFH